MVGRSNDVVNRNSLDIDDFLIQLLVLNVLLRSQVGMHFLALQSVTRVVQDARQVFLAVGLDQVSNLLLPHLLFLILGLLRLSDPLPGRLFDSSFDDVLQFVIRIWPQLPENCLGLLVRTVANHIKNSTFEPHRLVLLEHGLLFGLDLCHSLRVFLYVVVQLLNELFSFGPVVGCFRGLFCRCI